MTAALEGVSGEQHALAALYPRERPGTHFTGGWLGPRAGLDGRKISSLPASDPGPSSLESVAIPTELPGPHSLPNILRRIKWRVKNLGGVCEAHGRRAIKTFFFFKFTLSRFCD